MFIFLRWFFFFVSFFLWRNNLTLIYLLRLLCFLGIHHIIITIFVALAAYFFIQLLEVFIWIRHLAWWYFSNKASNFILKPLICAYDIKIFLFFNPVFNILNNEIIVLFQTIHCLFYLFLVKDLRVKFLFDFFFIFFLDRTSWEHYNTSIIIKMLLNLLNQTLAIFLISCKVHFFKIESNFHVWARRNDFHQPKDQNIFIFHIQLYFPLISLFRLTL